METHNKDNVRAVSERGGMETHFDGGQRHGAGSHDGVSDLHVKDAGKRADVARLHALHLGEHNIKQYQTL